MFCDYHCPQQCVCEGLALKCSSGVNPLQYLNLRYLDLSFAINISDTLDKIHFVEYLIYLNASHCELSSLTLHDMRLLRVLDISNNFFTNFDQLQFSEFESLTLLDMSENPFAMMLDATFTDFLHKGQFVNLESLFMKRCNIMGINNEVFSPLSSLKLLDIRENWIKDVFAFSLSGLGELQELHTDMTKLCCDYFHPSLTTCKAPEDELSSCDDLLSENFFRICLWVIAVVAVVGNIGVLATRLVQKQQRQQKSPSSAPAFNILVQNLCVSDLLMGVYMVMIGIADVYYNGVYVAEEKNWRESWVCVTAGFISLVSSEVSAFVACLITLDRVLIICFSFNYDLHLTKRSTVVLACCAWGLGLILATIPLVVGMEFYGQTGICLPLPITRQVSEILFRIRI